MSKQIVSFSLSLFLLLVAAAFAPSLFAAGVETVGDLKVSGFIDNTGGDGIIFPNGSTQASACSCAYGILPLSLGGTGSAVKNFVDLSTDQTVEGTKTFSSRIGSTVATGTAPLQVYSTTMVTNLNAQMVAGKELTDLDLRYGQRPVAQLPRINLPTNLDSDGQVGSHTSITIGSDGLPVISYHDATNGDLKVAHCSDTSCTSATITALDSAGVVGLYTSITIGFDGLPVISYFDSTNGDLKVAHCSDVSCTSATITTLDSAGSVGYYTSITTGGDGHTIISYYDATNGDLKVAHCADVSCTSATITTLDSTGVVGYYTSITAGSNGALPVISYYDLTNGNLKLAQCNNFSCTTADIRTVDSAGNVGLYTSIAIGNDGMPVISFHDTTNGYLKVAHCNDVYCSSATISTLDSLYDVGRYSSITIGSDGMPIISYYDTTHGFLRVAHCTSLSCTSATNFAAHSNPGVGLYTSITVGSDGLPIISYYDSTNQDLIVLKCANQFCIRLFSRR
jgi:hypothetical protein